MFVVIRQGKTKRIHCFSDIHDAEKYWNRTMKGAEKFTLQVTEYDQEGESLSVEDLVAAYQAAKIAASKNEKVEAEEDEVCEQLEKQIAKNLKKSKATKKGANEAVEKLQAQMVNQQEAAKTTTFTRKEKAFLAEIGGDIIEAIESLQQYEPGEHRTPVNIAFKRLQRKTFENILDKVKDAQAVEIIEEADAYTDETWLSYNIDISVYFWAEYYGLAVSERPAIERSKKECIGA